MTFLNICDNKTDLKWLKLRFDLTSVCSMIYFILVVWIMSILFYTCWSKIGAYFNTSFFCSIKAKWRCSSFPIEFELPTTCGLFIKLQQTVVLLTCALRLFLNQVYFKPKIKINHEQQHVLLICLVIPEKILFLNRNTCFYSVVWYSLKSQN